jgi:hypothetical protein
MQRTLLEDVFNCFQLTTLAMMIPLVDAPHLEILSKSSITCAKLKQYAQGIRGTVLMNDFNGPTVLMSLSITENLFSFE